MIKINELRCNNWVEVNGGQYTVNGAFISEIEKKTCTWRNGVKPIPLTPEILEKCGFSKLPHFTVQNTMSISMGRRRFMSIGCVGTPNEIIFITDECANEVESIITARNFDYDGKTHLHQLQNLFFALTGTELKYQS